MSAKRLRHADQLVRTLGEVKNLVESATAWAEAARKEFDNDVRDIKLAELEGELNNLQKEKMGLQERNVALEVRVAELNAEVLRSREQVKRFQERANLRPAERPAHGRPVAEERKATMPSKKTELEFLLDELGVTTREWELARSHLYPLEALYKMTGVDLRQRKEAQRLATLDQPTRSEVESPAPLLDRMTRREEIKNRIEANK